MIDMLPSVIHRPIAARFSKRRPTAISAEIAGWTSACRIQ
jgi:hypothetical protein